MGWAWIRIMWPQETSLALYISFSTLCVFSVVLNSHWLSLLRRAAAAVGQHQAWCFASSARVRPLIFTYLFTWRAVSDGPGRASEETSYSGIGSAPAVNVHADGQKACSYCGSQLFIHLLESLTFCHTPYPFGVINVRILYTEYSIFIPTFWGISIGIKRRMIDIGKKIRFWFLQTVWKRFLCVYVQSSPKTLKWPQQMCGQKIEIGNKKRRHLCWFQIC